MIQLNLLPDVKLEYVKAQRARRLVSVIAFFTTAGAIVLLVLMLGITGLQKKHLNDVAKDVAKESSQLKSKKNIAKVLTVQNQLQSLTGLHAAKPAASRVFDYLNQVTPNQVSINSFDVDFNANTMTIAGTADALSSVNKYVDTLKFTKYTSDATTDQTKAFSDVVLSTFGLTSGGQNTKPATYSIKLAYDKNIFDVTQVVKLTVPTLTSTRSGQDQPNDLFQAGPAPAINKGSN